MSLELTVEELMRRAMAEGRDKDQVGPFFRATVNLVAQEDRLLAAIPQIIAELRSQGIAEEELNAAALAKLRALAAEEAERD